MVGTLFVLPLVMILVVAVVLLGASTVKRFIS